MPKPSRLPESQGLTDWVLPISGLQTVSTGAAVINAASYQALRQPEQTNETGSDDQQSQASSSDVGVEKLLSVRPGRPWKAGPLQHSMMQLFLAFVVPVVLLVGLTALLAARKLSFSRNAVRLLKFQNSIWIDEIVTLASTAMVVALQR